MRGTSALLTLLFAAAPSLAAPQDPPAVDRLKVSPLVKLLPPDAIPAIDA